MNYYGMFRVAAVAPHVRIGDVQFNVDQIISHLDSLNAEEVKLAVFPEMSMTGYTLADLFNSDHLDQNVLDGIDELDSYSLEHPTAFIVGAPVWGDRGVYNCAFFFCKGLQTIIAKSYIPCYGEFYERRWWRPVPRDTKTEVNICGHNYDISPWRLIEIDNTKIGIEICEDLWVPIPPSSRLALAGAQIIVNLSASPDHIGKYAYLRSLIERQSASAICGYVYAGAGWGESSTDLVFDGKAIIAENGRILAANKRWTPEDNVAVADIDVEYLTHDRRHMTTFGDCADNEVTRDIPVTSVLSEVGIKRIIENTISGKKDEDNPADRLMRYVDPHPFVPQEDDARSERCDEIINIQAAGLARRLDAIGCRNAVIGISGGLDSTLALLVAVKAFDRLGLDRKGIAGITMPGFGTTDRTHTNALALMEALGVTSMEIPIAKAVTQHFEDIGHDPKVHDVTYENSQARERTQILMDMANRLNGIVVGTGDLSELALGWATYNGDQMSMYGVNAGVPKTLVRHLVRHFSLIFPEEVGKILADIIDTPISPELLPAAKDGEILQKTEDLVGPYELHDFFLYHTLRFGARPEKIAWLAGHAFDGEYDRATIDKWLEVFIKRFFSQQFKRSCMPDGPKVGSVCLSPRGDWRMPSDAPSSPWMPL